MLEKKLTRDGRLITWKCARSAADTSVANPGNVSGCCCLAGGGEQMKVKIQLRPELYNHIRTLVHDELNEQKNRQKFEQLAMKIRGQLDQLSAPKVASQVVQKSIGARF